MKLIVFILISSCSYGQTVFYQDVFNGNVCVVGLSSWDTTNLVLHNHGTSNIRKAFLVSGRQVDDIIPNMDYSIRVTINNSDYVLNNSNQRTVRFPAEYLHSSGSVHVIDVTNSINSTSFQTVVHINEYYQSIPVGENNALRYYGMSLVVLYNDPIKSPVNFCMWLNNKSLNDFPTHHSYTNLMPINTIEDVGVSISTGHLRSTIPAIQDGSYVWINNDSIGLIGGDDEWNISSLGTIMGQFSYENGNLHGIGDDTNSPLMNQGDALVNINSYVQNNATSFDLTLEYQKPNPTLNERSSNPIWATYITYTTPCAPFDVSVPNDTTVCYGSQAQLSTSGGQSYEWEPATGLSCTTCPNPIFSADSSMLYTVRIWNNDSCSVVRPVKINVRPQPQINTITSTPTECGAQNGSLTVTENGLQEIVAVSSSADTTSVLGNTIANLGAGNYTVFYTDVNGCQSKDTTVTIGTVNNTVAGFTVTPQSGGAPLDVSVNNTSQHANQFEWFVNGVQQNNPFNGFTADTSGTYEIMLVAWQHSPACADTTYASVLVYDSLIVLVPNVFTPNADGINDFFSITVNQPVKMKLVIVNRWGNEVFSFDGTLSVGLNDLWNGGEVTDGVYFYEIGFSPPSEGDTGGGLNPDQLKKDGFVTVVR